MAGKVTKTITYKFQEVAGTKAGIPVDTDATVIVQFPVGDLIIAKGKMTFNTKR